MLFLASLCLVLPSVSIVSDDVLVVDAGGGGDFVTIQAAVDAAGEGDVVLVAGGTYAGFEIDGKALRVLADSGSDVTLSQPAAATPIVRVRNLSPGQTVQLRGLSATSFLLSAPQSILELRDNEGAVVIEDCTFSGGLQPAVFSGDMDGAHVTSCARVLLVRSVFDGRPTDFPGMGLVVQDSAVRLFGCTVRGSHGIDGSCPLCPGADGGSGLVQLDGRVVASASLFAGGDGGDGGGHQGCQDGGGGFGVVMNGAGRFRARDCQLVGGPAGTACGNGVPGQGVLEQGTETAMIVTTPARTWVAPSPVRENGLLLLDFAGEPGDAVYLLTAITPSFHPLRSPFFPDPPFVGGWTSLGILDAQGSLIAAVPITSLPTGLDSLLLQLRTLVVHASGRTEGLPRALVTVLDESF